MSSELEQHLIYLEKRLREGDMALLQSEIDGTDIGLIPRAYAARIANLARRASRAQLAVMILYPYVRGGKGAAPNAEEISEYAVALTFIGAWEEAFGLLRKVNAEEFPQSLLYQAHALFARWDYAGAIKPLESFIKIEKNTHYETLVAKLNLGSAYLSEGMYEQADILLKEVYEISKAENYRLLASNSLERLSESAIQLKHFRRAEELLYEAEANLQGSSNVAMLFIKKWRVFLNIQKEGLLEHHEKKLKEIKAKAVELEHWETVRDCERFEATYKKDKKLLTHLLFGTPHEHFKKKLLKEFKTPFKIPESYLWGLDITQIDSSAMILDLKTGKIESRNSEGIVVLKGEGLLEDSQSHKVLNILTRDFYSPCNYRSLFAHLFPGQAYQPQISDERVLGAVNELREWILTNQLPIEIQELKGFFRVHFLGPVLIKVHRKNTG